MPPVTNMQSSEKVKYIALKSLECNNSSCGNHHPSHALHPNRVNVLHTEQTAEEMGGKEQ